MENKCNLTELTTLIKNFSEEMMKTNPMFTYAVKGKFTKRMLEIYLNNVHYLVTHTPIHLSSAIKSSISKYNDEKLVGYFRDKMAEEVGHDQWAIDDLEKINKGINQLDLLPSMINLVNYLTKQSLNNPYAYAGYPLLAEMYLVYAGPTWLKNLKEICHIDISAMTIVTNHIELDIDHIQHDLEDLAKIDFSNENYFELKNSLIKAMKYLEDFGKELTCGENHASINF